MVNVTKEIHIGLIKIKHFHLIKMFDQWSDSLEAGGQIDVIYTYLEKAFDKVPHQRLVKQESHAVAGKPRDAAVNSDRYRVRWHFAGAISVSRMQSVSGCTVYA